MKFLRGPVSLLLITTLFSQPASAGLGGDKAMYVGGTLASPPEKTEGKPRLGETDFLFEYKGSSLHIPFRQINSLEYGQKAGRRLGLAIAVSPLFIFSHKRRHFLTIGFLDDNNKQQAAVLELGKNVISPLLSGLEQRTGKKVEYEDAEARKTAEKK
ncbi:MAG: hypothetical protein HYX26_00890 [Acidobacteriales bacterium]|nr:hypothetical protein [Terriglobales bacterium]